MSETAKHITRFRRNLKQFIVLKNAGELNKERLPIIKKKLQNIASMASLDFDEEWKIISKKERSPNHASSKKMKAKKDFEQRENPVKVPFTITLKDIDQLHSIRSVKKLNSYVGHKHPCYVARHSGEKPDSHISFRYSPDYHKKKYLLEILLDGKLKDEYCSNTSFKDAWSNILSKHGDLVIHIKSQDHAKKVLGAKEYRRQEKELKKATPKTKKTAESSTKKTTVKTKKKAKPSTKKAKKEKAGKQQKQTKEVNISEAKAQLQEAKSVFQMLKEKYA